LKSDLCRPLLFNVHLDHYVAKNESREIEDCNIFYSKKNDDVCRAHSVRGNDEKCMQNFSQNIVKC
jgi:hypothetical protein